MDLIYADVIDGVIYDQGTLNVYDYDCSFGEKENNFQIKAPMGATELKENQVVYIMNTEYGGVIDAIEVDTTNRYMIYTGRTWHGILENKILYPLPGHDYFYVNGDANEVLRELLERMNVIPGDLNELYVQPAEGFMTVSSEESGIYVEARVASESGNYAHGYTFIRDLLYAFHAKLQIINGVLSAVENVDYSNDDDFWRALINSELREIITHSTDCTAWDQGISLTDIPLTFILMKMVGFCHIQERIRSKIQIIIQTSMLFHSQRILRMRKISRLLLSIW